MEKTRHPCVYLDVTHLEPQFVLKRFPGIAAACRQFGIDITKDKIPVRPGAHYMIGGVTVDLEGRTTIPGLWAAGEVSSSGLHGANRLASNSLLEGLVYGAHAGRGASQALQEANGDFRVYPLENAVVVPPAEPLDLEDIRNSLKSLMWRQCGVRRSGEGLSDALEAVDQWRRYVLARQFADIEGWELQNMLTLARVMIQAALLREESRGVHLRTDFPKLDDARWQKHLWFERSLIGGAENWGAA
jgi:L-aspartate oxidase